MLNPRGNNVLVQPVEADSVSAGGIHLPESARTSESSQCKRGIVRAVGPGGIMRDGSVLEIDLSEGEEVFYSQFQGVEVEYEGSTYVLMDAVNILARVVEE